jgi:nucleoside-diphosphate-sugar epimerase
LRLLWSATRSEAAWQWQVVAVFGVGLLGTHLVEALRNGSTFAELALPYHWSDHAQQQGDGRRILTQMEQVVKSLSRQWGSPGRLDLVWSAGQSGFGSSGSELDVENAALASVLDLVDEFRERWPGIATQFHLISSAGGLFEGQLGVGPHSKPDPLQPYGQSKLAQEVEAQGRLSPMPVVIYRPSSVYGPVRHGQRMGLIATLLVNAYRYRVSILRGETHTLRDYVLASDVAQFMASRITPHDPQAGVFVLASARPTSLAEVVRMVEEITHRKLLIQYQLSPNNALSNTYLPSVLPRGWGPVVPLEVGIRQVYRAMLARGTAAQ